MQTTPANTQYHAYLLRIWQADTGWQASLQDAATNQRVGFAGLEELFAFLMNEVERTHHQELPASTPPST